MVLTTAEIALGAPAIAVAGTLLGAWIQSRRDERRTQAEREQERLRWAREDGNEAVRRGHENTVELTKRRYELTDKWASDRRETYSDFLATTREWMEALETFRADAERLLNGGSDEIPEAPAGDQHKETIRRSLACLELLASQNVRQKATECAQSFTMATLSSRLLLRRLEDNDFELAVRSIGILGDFVGKVTVARLAFLLVAQAEIGIAEEGNEARQSEAQTSSAE